MPTGRARSLRRQLFLARRAAPAVRHLRLIPDVTLDDLFPGIDQVSVRLSHRVQPRGLPYGDAFVLSLITAWARPRRIFEIGTGTGEGTLLIARQAPDARIDTLDLGEEPASLGTDQGDQPLEAEAVGRAYRSQPQAERVTQHLGDSAGFDFSAFHGEMDLVFVDGAHTEHYVARDSRAALAMLAPGGTVVWDDCHLRHAGVSKALANLRREGHDVCRVDATRLAVLRSKDADVRS